MNPCSWVVLLTTLVVGIKADETDHQREIRGIENGIDQLIYRIIKLENGIDARRAPDKVRGYKNLSYRVSNVKGTGCRDDSFQCGGNDPQCVNNLLVCDGLRDCRNGADEEDCGLPFKTGDKFDVMSLRYDCTLNAGSPIKPYFIIDTVEIADSFKATAEVHVTAFFDDGENTYMGGTSGVYNLATGILEILWPVSNRVGWYVNFNDHIVRVTIGESNVICGEAAFSLNH